MTLDLEPDELAVLRQILFARDFALPVLLAKPVGRLQDKVMAALETKKEAEDGE